MPHFRPFLQWLSLSQSPWFSSHLLDALQQFLLVFLDEHFSKIKVNDYHDDKNIWQILKCFIRSKRLANTLLPSIELSS